MGFSVVFAAMRMGNNSNANKNTVVLLGRDEGEAAGYGIVPGSVVVVRLPRRPIGFRPGAPILGAKEHHLEYEGKTRTLGIQ